MSSVHYVLRAGAALALCIAVPFSFAQTPGTSGPANPKEMGKPGTAANSGTGKEGAMNRSDAKGATATSDGATVMKRKIDIAKKKRAAKTASPSASMPS
ncbi:MAG: hypothetical protein H7274_22525 [Rhodoferax sp.]|nr:hypothetical protein [Rhodoferax sp.]